MSDQKNVYSLKTQIRNQIRTQKRSLNEEERVVRSGAIFRKLEQHEGFQSAKTVLAYWSMRDEVHTHDFILRWFGKKVILLPVIFGDQLKIRRFEGLEKMEEEPSMGILEPVGNDFDMHNVIDLAIVPGMAFDNMKNRLGRGRAYYDRLFSEVSTFKIGVCFDFQIVPAVPVTPVDVPMDLIMSETLSL